MPNVGRKNVEKAQRRGDRTNQRRLVFAILADHIGIRSKSAGNEPVCINFIKSFVVAGFGGRLGMKRCHGTKRCRICVKERGWQAQKDSDTKDAGEHEHS